MAELARALSASLEPADLGLVDLEYKPSDDPYDASDKTKVGRTSTPETEAVEEIEPESMTSEPAFDDATIRMDRPFDSQKTRVASRRESAPSAPVAAVARKPMPSGEELDETALLPREELSTAKRQLGEVPPISREKQICAMCQTANAPHVRACVACGVSLASEDQEAVRARVAAPRTAHMAAPHMPPPTSGAFPHVPQHGGFAHSPMHGVPAAQPWATTPPGFGPPPPPEPPPSMWQRFLTWTGLKGR
jgi:hypothetical protein